MSFRFQKMKEMKKRHFDVLNRHDKMKGTLLLQIMSFIDRNTLLPAALLILQRSRRVLLAVMTSPATVASRKVLRGQSLMHRT